MTVGATDRRVRVEGPPPPTWRHSRSAAVVMAVVAAVSATAMIWLWAAGSSSIRFVVVDRGSGEGPGEIVYERTVEPGETFVLEHTHSVTERLVRETFSIADAETIALEELWFDEFGPNLPAGPEVFDYDVTYLHEGGAIRVLHHGFPIGIVPLRVGSSDVDHVLTFSDQERVRLLDITRRGAWVDLVVQGG